MVGLSALAVIQPPAVATPPPPSTLTVGQRLTPPPANSQDLTGSALVSPSSEFQFSIYFDQHAATSGYLGLEIDQITPVVVGGLWNYGGTGTSAGYATLQADGNFVLYAKQGTPIWSTRTAGTGSNNRLVMQDDGNLVLYTETNRVVWSSGTHDEVLISGEKLMPGQYLRNAYSHTDPPTTVTMQPDGDLVARYHGVVTWASNTTVPGSYLLMQPNGDLVIIGGGRTLWRSGTGTLTKPEDGRPFVDVGEWGQFEVDFTPSDLTGGGIRDVWDSWSRPGEAGRTTQGDLRHMTAGSVLRPGRGLASANGNRLAVQRNGNLVLRGPDGEVRWQARTAGHPGAVLTLRRSGRLVLHQGDHVLWVARITATPGDDLRIVEVMMRSNGVAVAHSSTGAVRWTSRG